MSLNNLVFFPLQKLRLRSGKPCAIQTDTFYYLQYHLFVNDIQYALAFVKDIHMCLSLREDIQICIITRERHTNMHKYS